MSYAFVLFDERVATAAVADGSDGMAFEVSSYIVRADDTRRPDVDLCCSVLVREDELRHGLGLTQAAEAAAGLYVAGIGALLSEADSTTPVAYSVNFITRFERTGPCGESRIYDGFESAEDLFDFVNDVPAANLVGSSYEHMLNPPVEPYEGP